MGLCLEVSFLYNDFDQMTEQDLFYVGFSNSRLSVLCAKTCYYIFLKDVNGFYMVNSCHIYIYLYFDLLLCILCIML